MSSAHRAAMFTVVVAAAAAAALFVVQKQQMSRAAMRPVVSDTSSIDSGTAMAKQQRRQTRRPGPIPKVITVRKKVQKSKPSRPGGKSTRPKQVGSVSQTRSDDQDKKKSK